MELDELKSAWQVLDQRLETSNRLQLHAFREGKFNQLKHRLRPLFWGQVAQMVLGVAVVSAAVAFWTAHRDEASMLLSGLLLHAYGVALVITAGTTLGRMSAIDHAAPVLTLQKQLARLRRFYILSGMWAGLPWWFLWMPIVAMLVKSGTGVNLYARAPMMFVIGTVLALAGLAGTWWFGRWSRHPSRPRLAKTMQDSLSGRSVLAAQAVLDEIAAFEKD